MDVIVIVTENYPFGRGEEFFQTEIQYIAKNFSLVHILSLSEDSRRTRQTPPNVQVSRIDTSLSIVQKLLCMRFIVFKEFLEELFIMKNVFKKQITWQRLKLLLWTMAKGHVVLKKIGMLTREIPKENRLLLYSYWMHHGAYAIAKLRKKGVGDTAICRAHGFDLYFDRNSTNYIPLRSFIVKYLDRIFPISLSGKKYLELTVPDSKDKLFVSRLGVLQKSFKKHRILKESGVFNVLSISNLIPVKRVHLIIQALACISESRVKWIHIGDGPLREELLQLALDKLSRKRNIKFKFMGYMANDDVLKYYCSNQVDLFINVSESEGIPVTMMEAQSFGVPILALDVGGVAEIVNAENGILLPKDVLPNGIALQIEKCIHLSSEEKILLHDAAHSSWQHTYNAKVNYMDFIAEIKQG